MPTIEEIRTVVSRLGRKYGVKDAYLFGSYAKNQATEDSDIDLIIDMSNMRKYKDYFHFCSELEGELGKEVDVTSEDGMLPGFFDMIKDDRVLLYGA